MKGTIPSRQACYVWLVIFLTMLSDVFGRLTRITMPSPRPRQVREVDAHHLADSVFQVHGGSVELGDENSLFIIPQINVVAVNYCSAAMATRDQHVCLSRSWTSSLVV
jgi:hypothetical protein